MPVAYGTGIHSDFDLESYLASGRASVSELTLKGSRGMLFDKGLECVFPMSVSHGRQLILKSDRAISVPLPGQKWRFEVRDVVTFEWRTGSSTLNYRLCEKGTLELVAFWLIHVCIPLYQSLEENLDFLHAGAVEMKNGTVVFVAPSMGGKSTTTEYFVRRGHSLVSDDKLGTFVAEGRFMAVPSHTRYRPYRKFEDLGFKAREYLERPGHISAIFALNRVAPGDPIRFREIAGFRKFNRLMPNYIFGFPHMQARRLEYLAGLVNRVPLFELDVPNDLGRMEEVYEAVCDHTGQEM
jgi:hypothetical protein